MVVLFILKRFWEWLRPVPSSLMMLVRQRRPPKGKLSNLYVLQVNFEVTSEHAQKLAAAFEPHSKKYGLDFIVLEPGMTLKRFDEI